MSPTASQSYGRTAGDNWRYWGGTANKLKTDGEEARGGERAAQVGGATPPKSGHWTGHQGQHGTGRQSVVRADGV